MEVQRLDEARMGFEHWTLRCTRCGHIDQVQMSTDPLKSDASGWMTGELRPPHWMRVHRHASGYASVMTPA